MSLRAVAARLDNTWKNFAAGLDERTTVMALSSLFHQKAENVSFRWFFLNLIFTFLLISSTSAMWRTGPAAVRSSKWVTTSPCWSSPSISTSLSMRECVRPTPRWDHCQPHLKIPWLTFSPPLQVHSTSKKLLYQLDHLVQLTNQTPNESPQKKHVSICYTICRNNSFHI